VWTELTAVFDGWPTEVRSVFFVDSANLFIVGHVYACGRGKGPLAVLSEVPRGAVPVWNASPRIHFPGRFMSCHMGFLNGSVFFVIVDVTEKDVSADKEKWTFFLDRVLTVAHPSCGFVLLGHGLVPTIFYPPFELTSHTISHASLFVAGIHYVGRQILMDALGLSVEQLDNEIRVDYLPLLTQLTCLDDPKIQKIATRCTIRLFGTVSFAKCQEFAVPCLVLQDWPQLARWERFLLAVIVAHFDNAIPPPYHKELYNFLTEISAETSPCAMLALAILLQGFATWLKVVGYDKQVRASLYQRIIRGILAQRADSLDGLFCQLACALPETFLDVFPNLISEFAADRENPEDKLRGLFTLYTRVVHDNQKVFGGCISLVVAKAYRTVPQFALILSEALKHHGNVFSFVAYEKDVCVIGTPDGFVHAFEKGRPLFEEQMIDGGINLVSMAPKLMVAVALSAEAGRAVCFRLLEPVKGFFAKKRNHEKWSVELPKDGSFKIVWTDDTNCEITVNPKRFQEG
jgi:hypothetical protein